MTRDLIRAGQLLKLELLDHLIVGNGNFTSPRSLGYFYQQSPTVSETVSASSEK